MAISLCNTLFLICIFIGLVSSLLIVSIRVFLGIPTVPRSQKSGLLTVHWDLPSFSIITSSNPPRLTAKCLRRVPVMECRKGNNGNGSEEKERGREEISPALPERKSYLAKKQNGLLLLRSNDEVADFRWLLFHTGSEIQVLPVQKK